MNLEQVLKAKKLPNMKNDKDTILEIVIHAKVNLMVQNKVMQTKIL